VKEGKEMSSSVELQGSRELWEPALAKPLDEAVWQAWLAKNRGQGRRRSAARMKAVNWVSIAGLLAAAGLWSRLTLYDVVVRFIMAAGAIVVMFQAFHARRYALAAVFGAPALVYNPVAPAFSLSGGWQRAVALASAAPFVASLAWRNVRTEHNE
jgi:hypothetical protein